MGLKESGLRGSLRNVSVGIVAIPDSEVSRPQDNGTGTDITDKRGVEINPNTNLSKVRGTISANTSGLTRAYIIDLSDNSTLADVDVSGLSAGDDFDITVALSSGQSYAFVADAEGGTYSSGFNDDSTFPFTSEHVDITGGILNNTEDSVNPLNIVTVGAFVA